MFSNIKVLFFLLLIQVFSVHAQEPQDQKSEFNEDPETVFFNLEVFRPVVLGNSALTGNYQLKPGFAFDFNWFILPDVTVGTYFSAFEGNVINRSAVGNISSTMTYLFGIDGGYYYEIDNNWNILTTAGIGSIQYTSKAPEDKFHEQGSAYWFQVQVAYRFNRTVAAYFKMNPRLDKLTIETPEDLDNYFNRHVLLNPGFGIRINLQNPGG